MIKAAVFAIIIFLFQNASAQNHRAATIIDSVYWIQLKTDSGVVHAAIATPQGEGPFPAIIILHGTHGFAEEYVQLARQFAQNGIVGIAACWFAGRRGAGINSIKPIECNDAPPLIDVPGPDRFRIARHTIDSLVKRVRSLPGIQSNHLFLFGHSRGAGAALDYALTHPGNVYGIVLNSGGYPPEVAKRVPEIQSAVLILHGTADSPADGGSTFTHISMANQFETALRAANKKVIVKYYEGRGHNSLFSDPAQFENTVQHITTFIRQADN